VSIGSGFGLALTQEGNVYSWGENHLGQLGSGDNVTKATPQLMQHLDTKRVSYVACGSNFVIALGQTLASTGQEDLLPLAQSVDAYPERDSQATLSGRWSKSQHRTDDHPSPLRTKLKKRSIGHRSTGRITARVSDRVHGNRHVGGCCGHERDLKPRPISRSPPNKKQKKKIVLSPSRRFERMTAEREDEFNNYRNLVEARFTQMLEEEKTRLRRQFADKKDLVEKKLRFENEEKLQAMTESLKKEFG